MRATLGPWTAEYRGGRTADVFHAEYPDHAIDCIEAGEGDYFADRDGWSVTPETLQANLEEWAKEMGAAHSAHTLPYIE